MGKGILILLIIIAIGVVGIGVVLGYNTWVSQPSVSPQPAQGPRATPQPVIEVSPSAPSNLTAEALSSSEVGLRWFDNSYNEKGFTVYRDHKIIATLPANATAYKDTGLKPATTYQYTVEAYNEESASGICQISIKTLNPPITVRLDKIGVHDNGEDPLRGKAGEVYVGIIVTDGNTTVEKQFPAGEGQFYKLCKNEIADVGATIFSVDEVGDYLRIAAVGYENDGGPGETLLYKALGVAAEAYMTGGAATLLEMSDVGLGNLIGKLFGAEDDWLGSYEKACSYDDNWGIGIYTDIACEEEDGTLGLRLWFTIESPLQPSTLSPAPTPTPAPVPTHSLITDSFTLAPFDEASLEHKYAEFPSRYPFNEYGFYLSELFSLHENETANIILRANVRVCVENYMSDCGSELHALIFRRMDSHTVRSHAAEIIACEVDNIAPGPSEARVTFRALESGSYQVGLINYSTVSTWCEYAVSMRE